ncbi:MAG: uracil-DNA glycosylase family protein [Rubripirellula sp.]
MSNSDETNQPALQAEDIVAEAAALAAHLQRAGVQFLPAPNENAVQELTDQFAQDDVVEQPPAKPPTTPVAAPAPAPTRSAPNAAPVTSASVSMTGDSYPGPSLPAAERQSQLEVISQEVAACVRCEVLAGCRTNTVFGEGSSSPRVVFFGEGPGADEDRSGRPFVGKAGQLLTKMIEACTFQREDVYILNTVKCRPPGNRNPELDELTNCREYYERQLAILQPEYIVCMGAVSAQELLKSKLSVGRLRGKFHRYFQSKVLVTYHPAYLLRNPSAKKAAWVDLQLMLQDAGIQL